MKTSVESTRVRTEDEVFLTEEEASDVLSGRISRVDCEVVDAAVAFAGTADLRPVLLASNQRETWTVSSSLGCVKLCFDWVHYTHATEKGASVVAEDYELEVELQQGPRSLVTEAALYLTRRYGLAPQACSKYERGAALVGAFASETYVGIPEAVLAPTLVAM